MNTPVAPTTYNVLVGWNEALGAPAEEDDGPNPYEAVGATEGDRCAIRVLIVDDVAAIRDGLRDVLTECGFSVVGCAANGAAGVRQAEELLPSVVMMDSRMPIMDGIEATKLIRGALPNVQVVVVSAYDDRTLRLAARTAGAHSYVLKGAAIECIERAILAAASAPKWIPLSVCA